MHNLLTLVLLGILLTTVLVGGWCVTNRYRDLSAFENRLKTVQTEVDCLKEQCKSLETEGTALEFDLVSVESAVRQRLGYIREAEVVVRAATGSRP